MRNFVFRYQQTKDFVEKTEDLLDFLLPNFVDEGKSELVIAVGCTGGQAPVGLPRKGICGLYHAARLCRHAGTPRHLQKGEPMGTYTENIRLYEPGHRPPRLVAIGGGHGLSAMLRGLKRYTRDITAIVTVADDGGGSGALREDLGMLPPGDIRSCILSLANTEPTMREASELPLHRGEPRGAELWKPVSRGDERHLRLV